MKTDVQQLIPALRFPEFEGEWVKQKLGEICNKVGSGSTPRGGVEVYTKTGIPFIRSQNVINNQLILDQVHIPQIIHLKMSGSKVLSNDILLNITGGSIGRSCVVPDSFLEGNVNQHVSIIRLKEYNSDFLQSFLSSFRGQKLVFQSMTGSGREGLNFQSIREFKISFPSLPEQQKIASFLTTIDSRIQALEKKKSSLEQYNKGVMQKIFTQEIRFKDEDGKDFPEWEEKKLGEVYSFLSTNSFSRDKLNYDKGKTRNIHYGDIHTKFSSAFKIKNEKVPYINDDVDISQIKDESFCQEGDIVIADASEDYADIGKTIELVKLHGEKLLAGLHTFLARPISTNTKVGFSCHLFKSWKVRKQIMIIAQGTKVLGISKGRMSKISIEIPSIQEQTHIANFLTAIDKKIALVNEQIEKTKAYKKGLLQKMFV